MPSKTPEWKVAPGKPIDFINSVATSADGKRVVCGTFYHYYGKSQRGAYVPRVGDEDETGIFGTYCYNQSGAPLWKDEFDELYRAGEKSGRMMSIGLHPHIIGRAFRARAIREFLEYAKKFDGVWWATREEIADWYLQNHKSHIG